MQIKCYLFVEQFLNPIKTAVIDITKDMTDEEITERAKAELYKDFRVEIEDVKNPKHHNYNIIKPKLGKNRTSIFVYKGKRYRRADIMELHNLSPGQYNYLMNVKKYDPALIIEKGMELYKQPRS